MTTTAPTLIADPLVPLFPFQRRAVMSPARFTWNNWSRQTGKSFTFALRRLLRGIHRNRDQILLSASERQSVQLMTKVQQHLKAIVAGMDGQVTVTEGSHFEGTQLSRLETRVKHRGGRFDFKVIALPANPETVPGYTGDMFFDEFALHRDDRGIWGAAFPIASRGGGEIDICSTPRGMGNMFHKLSDNALFDRSTVTIEDAVAQGHPVDIDETRAALADEFLWRQEFMCEFMDDAQSFLTMEMIVAISDARLTTTWNADKAEQCKTEDLYVGMDIGRRHDLAVIWIWGQPQGAHALYTRGVIVMKKTPFRTQTEMMASILKMPNCRRACIDESGMGMPIAEELQQRFGASRVEAVTFTAPVKAALAGPMRVRAEDKSIFIPAEPEIQNDWNSIQKTVTTAGNVRYLAERNTDGHADRFWAAALGLHATDGKCADFDARVLARPVGSFSGGLF